MKRDRLSTIENQVIREYMFAVRREYELAYNKQQDARYEMGYRLGIQHVLSLLGFSENEIDDISDQAINRHINNMRSNYNGY